MVELHKDEGELVQEMRQLRERIAQLEAEAAAIRIQTRHETEDAFRRMADAAPVMLWMSGPDGLCNFFNKRWLAFRGRTMEQELGSGWASGVHPDERDACTENYLTAFRDRREFQMEYRLQRTDGEYRWIVGSGVPRFDAEGSFLGYMGSGMDVHDRKAAAAPTNSHLPLTEREKQVLVLIADGKSTKEVAAALGISYKTADSHRSKIMEKLDVHETASLVRYAVRQRLVQP
jgi:PAS domain S-box-containing protein